MKTLITTTFLLMALNTPTLFAVPVEFDWTAQSGSSQYNAEIQYSDGTTANGVFTPTGLLGYSFGTANGAITRLNHDPFFQFLTDTKFGPSFNTQGVIEPIPFPGNAFAPGYQE